jgi:hypothetical protein
MPVCGMSMKWSHSIHTAVAQMTHQFISFALWRQLSPISLSRRRVDELLPTHPAEVEAVRVRPMILVVTVLEAFRESRLGYTVAEMWYCSRPLTS